MLNECESCICSKNVTIELQFISHNSPYILLQYTLWKNKGFIDKFLKENVYLTILYYYKSSPSLSMLLFEAYHNNSFILIEYIMTIQKVKISLNSDNREGQWAREQNLNVQTENE